MPCGIPKVSQHSSVIIVTRQESELLGSRGFTLSRENFPFSPAPRPALGPTQASIQ